MGYSTVLTISAPVMAISQADGDGGESVTFLPRAELGRRFVLPRAAEYVLVACAELFGLDGGREWFVSHYLFGRIEDTGSAVA